MTDAVGRPGGPSSAAPIEPVPVSPLRASVPDAGEVGCIAQQVRAMMAMHEASEDMPVLSFATISAWSGLTLEQTRAAVRQLASKGVAEFWRMCWSDDGEPKGAGYALTDQGRKAAQGIEARSDETAQQAQPEGQEPDPNGCAQSTPTSEY